jgi:uncharacterized protein YbbK (DUF523 family)
MIRVLVSACLLGEKVRFNGKDAFVDSPIVSRWLADGRVVPFCPELAGGLGVPRPPAEIGGGDGQDVLDGRRLVVTSTGADVTQAFLRGAFGALDAARAQDVRLAVLKDGSPSCASGSLYDGTFSGATRSGMGVTAALLERDGIRVFSEHALARAAAYLETLERRG